ncbi:hypothetical protein MPNT_20116 [Candidatus Methylacidithermus pantelleriae]|uniref:Uncharacterized protein n=1 Tax=Candidatus Methylacidithermus pantelleriae TaxID=2744239 RepID=A0A8J2BJ66_9BACT|nr:hypothetical protein MPNT_20116 [Candidatus Methylacidithermus pantelleriae]
MPSFDHHKHIAPFPHKPAQSFAGISKNRFSLFLALTIEIPSHPTNVHPIAEAVHLGQGERILVPVDAERSGEAVCRQGNESVPQELPAPATPFRSRTKQGVKRRSRSPTNESPS